MKLLAEFPNLDTLITLSPMPGFRPWLKALLQREVQAHLDGVREASTPPRFPCLLCSLCAMVLLWSDHCPALEENPYMQHAVTQQQGAGELPLVCL